MNPRTDPPPPPPTLRHHWGLSHLTKLDPSPMDRVNNTDKKEKKLFSYMRKFRWDRLQSHI
jgi:hypothetical protein